MNVLYLSELRRIGQKQGLRAWEIPAAVLLEPHPFSSDNRLLTATMKKARPQLERRYRTRLEELYAKLSSGQEGRCVSGSGLSKEDISGRCGSEGAFCVCSFCCYI